MTLVLASQSPRRKEILSFFRLPFETRPSNFDESSLPYEGNPAEYARELARAKAEHVPSSDEELILAADTVVYRDGKIYGKPRNGDHAFEILQELVGSWHSVFTGVTIKKGATIYDDVEETRVLFNSPTEEQMRRYHQQLHCDDKAGGYAIQEAGALMVHSIEGCYYNVMGLPINTLNSLLTQVGISLWDHLS